MMEPRSTRDLQWGMERWQARAEIAEREARSAEREATILKIDLATARAAVDAYRVELDGCLARHAELERMRPTCVWRAIDAYSVKTSCTGDQYDPGHTPGGRYCPHCGARRRVEVWPAPEARPPDFEPAAE